jgi:hypothetical protein
MGEMNQLYPILQSSHRSAYRQTAAHNTRVLALRPFPPKQHHPGPRGLSCLTAWVALGAVPWGHLHAPLEGLLAEALPQGKTASCDLTHADKASMPLVTCVM